MVVHSIPVKLRVLVPVPYITHILQGMIFGCFRTRFELVILTTYLTALVIHRASGTILTLSINERMS